MTSATWAVEVVSSAVKIEFCATVVTAAAVERANLIRLAAPVLVKLSRPVADLMVNAASLVLAKIVGAIG